MKTSDKIILISILIICAIHLAVLLTAGPRYTEADIDAAWSDGYTAYQVDEYLPKTNHKAPLPGLKGKVSG